MMKTMCLIDRRDGAPGAPAGSVSGAVSASAADRGGDEPSAWAATASSDGTDPLGDASGSAWVSRGLTTTTHTTRVTSARTSQRPTTISFDDIDGCLPWRFLAT